MLVQRLGPGLTSHLNAFQQLCSPNHCTAFRMTISKFVPMPMKVKTQNAMRDQYPKK